jgi:SAM-dependent methyltransferase
MSHPGTNEKIAERRARSAPLAAPASGAQDLHALLYSLAAEYPPEMADAERADVPRIAFHLGLVLAHKGSGASVCDLGGGVGLFSLGCAALGMRSLLVDDFRDPVNLQDGEGDVLALHRSYGVRVLSRDVIALGIDDITERFDAVTSFDSMEHWHHSPKRLFAAALRALVPGGLFVLGVPNCVNLRKRLTVPLGRGRWSSMEEWYESPVFRGHVREPDVNDLRHIARDLGLVRSTILGRNWLGHANTNRLVRLGSRLIDRPLRLFPSLCSNLYLVGYKP